MNPITSELDLSTPLQDSYKLVLNFNSRNRIIRIIYRYLLIFRDTRYVLLMTENFAALRVLEKKFPEENADASVIFGSSFPKDQEFTQVLQWYSCKGFDSINIGFEPTTILHTPEISILSWES